ncbi:hypothetical protein [Vampirovibrio sp.]|uniref:hypothetical protein n=1 Tax=Vampirovibrio sp. TaxID=2717857 RepID=UPI00359411C1
MKAMIQFLGIGAAIYFFFNLLVPAPVQQSSLKTSEKTDITFQQVTAQSTKALITTAAFMQQEKKRLSANMAVTLRKLDQGINRLSEDLAHSPTNKKQEVQQHLQALQSDRIQVTQLQNRLTPAESTTLETIKAYWQAIDVHVNAHLLPEKK